jgi:hypothetical protein
MNELQELGLTRVSRPTWNSQVSRNYYQPDMQILYSAAGSLDTLALCGDTADWVIEAAQKLEVLGRFRVGWDSYGGLPLRQMAKSLTIRVLHYLCEDELPVPAVVLGSAGTVQLEWKAKGKELEIELGENDTMEFVKVSPGGDIEEGEAMVDPAKLHDLTSWLLRS